MIPGCKLEEEEDWHTLFIVPSADLKSVSAALSFLLVWLLALCHYLPHYKFIFGFILRIGGNLSVIATVSNMMFIPSIPMMSVLLYP